MKFYRLSLIRGLVFMVFGALVGILITILIRLLMGLPAWNAEPVLVAGAVLGSMTFMFGTGVLNDWFKWARGEDTPEVELGSEASRLEKIYPRFL